MYNYNDRGALRDPHHGGERASPYTHDNAGNIATAAEGVTTTHYGYYYANQCVFS